MRLPKQHRRWRGRNKAAFERADDVFEATERRQAIVVDRGQTWRRLTDGIFEAVVSLTTGEIAIPNQLTGELDERSLTLEGWYELVRENFAPQYGLPDLDCRA